MKWLAVYFLSCIGGAILAEAWMNFSSKAVAKHISKHFVPDTTGATERLWWLSTLTGVVERAIITTLVLWAPKVLVLFIGGWMALKLAGGWGLLKDPTPQNRYTYSIGLLGSVLSISWAIAVGTYFAPAALIAFLAEKSN